MAISKGKHFGLLPINWEEDSVCAGTHGTKGPIPSHEIMGRSTMRFVLHLTISKQEMCEKGLPKSWVSDRSQKVCCYPWIGLRNLRPFPFRKSRFKNKLGWSATHDFGWLWTVGCYPWPLGVKQKSPGWSKRGAGWFGCHRGRLNLWHFSDANWDCFLIIHRNQTWKHRALKFIFVKRKLKGNWWVFEGVSKARFQAQISESRPGHIKL